ncbi:type II toxin-antitoxin system RelE/ParE family toxin [Nanoarchaeota archaeon]
MYTLVYSEEILKQFRKLNKETKKRILSTLERIRIRPYAHVKRLVGSPYYCLRVGRYRVLINIEKNELIIFVIETGHRSSIYK